MTPKNENLDPVGAITAGLALLMSPTLASIVGHYAVIIVASIVGGAWSLGRRSSVSRSSALLFLLLISSTAAMITTGIAVLISNWLPFANNGISWLVAPIGLIIGAIGHDWARVGPWLVNRVGKLIDVLIALRRGEMPNDPRNQPSDHSNHN